MKRASLLILSYLFFSLAATSPSHAIFDNPISRAQGFLEANMLTQAIQVLATEISANPRNAEAHFLLGVCYLQEGRLEHAEERFFSATSLNSGYKGKIGDAYYKASLVQKKAGDVKSAATAFIKATEYKPAYKTKGYSIFIDLSAQVKGLEKEPYLDKALVYTQAKYQRNEIAKAYLRLAVSTWPGTKTDELKNKAAAIVGQDKVDQIFPPSFTLKTIFEQTYTWTDAYEKEYGHIRTFAYGKDDIQAGDTIEVVATKLDKTAFSGPEVLISVGDETSSRWANTQNGYFSQKVRDKRMPWEMYIISLNARKDIRVTVKVTRKIEEPPQPELISTL